eukprot:15466598-Alexandrium_andersonii.AAC.1
MVPVVCSCLSAQPSFCSSTCARLDTGVLVGSCGRGLGVGWRPGRRPCRFLRRGAGSLSLMWVVQARVAVG